MTTSAAVGKAAKQRGVDLVAAGGRLNGRWWEVLLLERRSPAIE